jgi:hypothetical protein
VTQARQPGSIWTGFVGRHRSRAKALLMALPLLILSVLVDHGLAGTSAPNPGHQADSHASDMSGAEGEAQLPGRGAVAMLDPLRLKSKFSDDRTAGPLGLTLPNGVSLPSFLPRVEPRIAQYGTPTHRRADARPRAPPVQAV